MRTWKWSVAILILAVLSALAIGLWRTSQAPPPALPLTVLFSCDTQGRLEPCGCFTGQYGGMTRMHTHMQTMPGDHIIRLDVGDAMPGTEDFRQIQYRHVLEAFQLMQYDALNLGHREIRLSADDLQAIAQSDAPLLSANVIDSRRGDAIFPAFRRIQRGDRTIAIVGVVDPNGTRDIIGANLQITPMAIAIANVLPQIADADLRILLAFADIPAMRQLASEFYEFDLILGGDVRQPSQELLRENRSILLATTNEARTLGSVRGTLTHDTGFSLEDWDMHLLRDNIEEAKDILRIVAAYRQEVRTTTLDIDRLEPEQGQVPGVVNPATYVGSQACTGCHAEAAEVWEKSLHAHAFDALVRRDSAADPQCIGCHTVGFGTPSGYRREMEGKKLVHVGCESCHGPGSEHVSQRLSGQSVLFRFRPLGPGDCKRCHYGQFSRPFDWDTLWPKIAH